VCEHTATAGHAVILADHYAAAAVMHEW